MHPAPKAGMALALAHRKWALIAAISAEESPFGLENRKTSDPVVWSVFCLLFAR